MVKGSLSLDKRKHPRVQVSIPIQFKVINEKEAEALAENEIMVDAKSRDLSAEGLFIVSDRQLHCGDILKVEVLLPAAQKPVRTFAEVIWISQKSQSPGQYGAGIYFMALKDEDSAKIRQFVADALRER